MKEVVVGSVLIFQKGKFLLIKSRTGPGKGLWNNPGGRLESGENIEDCAKREGEEETGLQLEIGQLINTYNHQERPDKLVIKRVYEADIIGGKLCIPDEEIEEARWFSAEEINNEEFTFGAKQSINDYLAREFGKTYHPNRTP